MQLDIISSINIKLFFYKISFIISLVNDLQHFWYGNKNVLRNKTFRFLNLFIYFNLKSSIIVFPEMTRISANRDATDFGGVFP